MSAPLLAYRKAANPRLEGDYGGRVWLSEHDSCAYCGSALSELGSFHAPAHNLVKTDDPNYGPAFCLACGFGRAEPNESEMKSWDDGLEGSIANLRDRVW